MIRMILSAATAITFSVLAALPVQAQMTTAEKTEVEQLVRDYILNNPEIIQEAMVKLEDKRRQAEADRQSQAIVELSDTIFNSEHQAVLGNPDGAVTMVEFFDYNCAYCKRAFSDMKALLETNPDLRIVMKEFPILSEGSLESARISVAVSKMAPERYGDFHRELLVRPGTANRAKALAIAEELGLDAKALDAEGSKDETLRNFSEVRMLAEALGITGTPSYVIGNQTVFGAVGYDTLLEKIVEARNCTTAVC